MNISLHVFSRLKMLLMPMENLVGMALGKEKRVGEMAVIMERESERN